MEILNLSQLENITGGAVKDPGDCAVGAVFTVVGIIGAAILLTNPVGLAAGMAGGLITGMSIGGGLGEMWTSCGSKK